MFLSEWREFSSAPSLAGKKNLMTACVSMSPLSIRKYRGADKSLARTGRKQANVSVRMAWIFFGALPCRKKRTWWQLVSQCWNRVHPWHASELISFLVGLRTYQHPGMKQCRPLARWSQMTSFNKSTVHIFYENNNISWSKVPMTFWQS